MPAPPSGAPVANAGPDQGNIAPNTLITLDGSGSTNPSGTPLTYAWAFTSLPAGSTAVLTNATSMSPSFTVDRDGDYVVQLIVNNGTVKSAVDFVTITTNNVQPIANAGPDQGNIAPGTLVTLNGSASTDSNGNLLMYSWALVSKPPGSTAVLTNATSVTPTLVVDRAGIYILELIVNDGALSSAPDNVIVTTNNVAPVANAGPDQGNVPPNVLVTLNGSGSGDANGDPFSYIWTLIVTPAGSAAVLANAGSVMPTFTVDRDGDYVAQLIVSDGSVNSAPDTVKITSNNVAPIGNAGPDQGNIALSTLVTLNGSGSGDANGDPITYSWTFVSKPATSAGVLVNSNSVSPSFTPDRSGNYVVQLIVNDGTVDSAPDTVLITTGNVAPVANAGPDQGGKALGSLINLDGSGSSDDNGDPLTYSWSLTTKPTNSTAVLAGANSETPTFTVDRAGDYIAQLIVSDGTVSSAPDSVLVRTNDVAPVANAGADQTVSVCRLVTLDGSSSSDLNGDLLTYSWMLPLVPAGSTAALANPTTDSPTFTADLEGSYQANLVVNDGTVDSSAALVTVTATPTYLAGLPTTQTLYTNQCAGCHRLGTFDTTGGAPDLSKKGLKVRTKFRDSLGNPILHNSRTLTDNQILDLCVFFQAN